MLHGHAQTRLAAVPTLALLGHLSSAMAADLPPPPPVVAVPPPPLVAPNPFQGSFTLYGWGAFWSSGEVGVGGLGPVDIGTSESDVDWLQILDGFFMANGELRYGRFGVYGDFIFVGLGNEVTGPVGFVDANWDLSAMIFTGAASYAFIDTPATRLQALAGFRYWGLDVGLELVPLVGPSPSADADLNLFDPVVGLRGQHFVTDRLYLEGTGFVGGALGDSDFLWDAYAGLGYQFTDHFSGSVGYRGMGLDYEAGGTVLDVIFHGPVAALTLRF